MKMRKVIITALIATMAFPAVATAQSPSDGRRDRHGERLIGRAPPPGDHRAIRDFQNDVRRDDRDDRRGRDRNWSRDDWRGYRDGNRALYARGNWRAPFRYRPFRGGGRIAPSYYGARYYINDPWRYRLPNPGYNQRWVRHYNDVLLVDTRRGIVIDVIRGFYW